MKKQNIVKDKSFDFAIRIVNLYKVLTSEQKKYIMSKQILRSGTSIGANVREAHNAESKADFIHKLGIAQKECNETLYWLELLYATHYLDKESFSSIYQEAEELLKIIKSITISTKSNLNISKFIFQN